MATRNPNKLKIAAWLFAVYILSFICYIPSLLERHGISLPPVLFHIKYLFVCVPAVTAVLLLFHEHSLKTYFSRMFSGKITSPHILLWFTLAAAGISVSYCYSAVTGIDIFQNAYPTTAAWVVGSIYLFIMGFIEEIAWRGFLLERVSSEEESVFNVVFVGIVWTIWHMPMWIIRNSLSTAEVLYLCLWTMLVAFILGTAYYHCRNILFAALLHATFNVCYPAPVQYNIAAAAMIVVIGTLLAKRNSSA